MTTVPSRGSPAESFEIPYLVTRSAFRVPRSVFRVLRARCPRGTRNPERGTQSGPGATG